MLTFLFVLAFSIPALLLLIEVVRDFHRAGMARIAAADAKAKQMDDEYSPYMFNPFKFRTTMVWDEVSLLGKYVPNANDGYTWVPSDGR